MHPVLKAIEDQVNRLRNEPPRPINELLQDPMATPEWFWALLKENANRQHREAGK